jgi:23S rRNA (guanosine2251-2'-O)-methyltransferase
VAQYIYGTNAVCERLKKGSAIEKIYLMEKYADPKVHRLIEENQIETEIVSRKALDDMTDNANHQGVVACISSYDYSSLDDIINNVKEGEYPLIVMLDGIEDPHNLGAILRTCDAIGVTGVIIPKHHSVQLTPTVAKVSSGAIEYVKVVQVTNLTTTIKELKKKGYWIVGAEASNSSDYRSVDYNMPVVLVIGSEGRGISRLVLSECDFKINLPMLGHVNSLNASVATAIILYQIHAHRFPIK